MGSLTYEYQDLEYVKLPKYNIVLLNFECILGLIYSSFHSLLHEYSITNSNLHDSLKLLYHCTFIELCKFINKVNPQTNIVIFIRIDRNDIEYTRILKFIAKLPCGVLYRNENIKDFIKKVDESNHLAIEDIENVIKQKKKTNSRYGRFRLFLKKNGLSYLAETFLKQPSNKILLLR